jgi:hypothetical protein
MIKSSTERAWFENSIKDPFPQVRGTNSRYAAGPATHTRAEPFAGRPCHLRPPQGASVAAVLARFGGGTVPRGSRRAVPHPNRKASHPMIEILSPREIDFLTGICTEFHDCVSNCGEAEAAKRQEWQREQAAKAKAEAEQGAETLHYARTWSATRRHLQRPDDTAKTLCGSAVSFTDQYVNEAGETVHVRLEDLFLEVNVRKPDCARCFSAARKRGLRVPTAAGSTDAGTGHGDYEWRSGH